MNLTWLDDFLTLAETGNFSRAADERHMTQPAFSRRIRALEEWLGTDLFDRSSQPARLTEAGLWLRKTAPELLAQVARLPGEARAVAEANATTLRIAATHALSFSFLPGWLRGLETRTTVGAIRLLSDVMAHCEALLQQSQVQFVLAHTHAQVPGKLHAAGFASVQIGRDVLLPVSAPDAKGQALHRLGGAKSKTVQVLGYSAESGLAGILQEVCGEALEKLPVQVGFTAQLASVLRTLALDGRGMAWLPETLVREDMASGRLLAAASDDWLVALEVRLFRDKTALSPAAETFWQAACAA